MTMSVWEIFWEASNLQTMLAITIGVVAGIVVVLLSRKGGEDDFDSELTDLEERKDHAVALLRELEAQKERIEPEAYDAQRTEHEKVAVEALRARDELLKKRRKQAPPPGFLADQPVARGLLWGIGYVVALGIAWIIISPDEIPPAAPAHAATPVAPPPSDPELTAIWKQLEKNPANVDALARGAAILMRLQRMDEARQYIDRALQLDPEHPGALVQYAAMLSARGRAAEGLARLDALVQKHPDVLDAWSLRGIVAMQAGDLDKARASLAEYIERAPDGPAKDQMKAILEGRLTSTETPPPSDGAALWRSKCALCHGDDGRAQTRMGKSLGVTDLTTRAWQTNATDDHIRKVVAQGIRDDAGKSRMQAFNNLTPEQLTALIAHIRLLASP